MSACVCPVSGSGSGAVPETVSSFFYLAAAAASSNNAVYNTKAANKKQKGIRGSPFNHSSTLSNFDKDRIRTCAGCPTS